VEQAEEESQKRTHKPGFTRKTCIKTEEHEYGVIDVLTAAILVYNSKGKGEN